MTCGITSKSSRLTFRSLHTCGLRWYPNKTSCDFWWLINMLMVFPTVYIDKTLWAIKNTWKGSFKSREAFIKKVCAPSQNLCKFWQVLFKLVNFKLYCAAISKSVKHFKSLKKKNNNNKTMEGPTIKPKNTKGINTYLSAENNRNLILLSRLHSVHL